MQQLINWLESHQLPCYYKKLLGIKCLGCGMQTAFILLLKGELIESLKTYPALIPVMFLFSFLILHIIFKFRKGAVVLKISFIFTVSIMVLSYIIKHFIL
ncbi:MAG TPA: DUF2752 domain-containing protein [Bacteroidales bacterium]|nr:DUF2752 domain-containing protein [Bacteroidales bacterium]HRX96310.1 DUF2752 domain-containing protein [Bacteroidales bacterium]